MEIRAKSRSTADLKDFLLVERRRLQSEIAHSDITTDHERAGYSNHMAENAAVVFEQARNAGLKRSQEHLPGEVEDALKRMDDGTYGACQKCGRAIDPARLRALPTASFCLSCQARRESH